MPKFNKRIDELSSMFDKWMYAIRHLPELLEKPQIMQEEIFTHLFEAAEIARFTPQEVYEYEESLKVYRDWYSITKTAVDKAKKEAHAEGRAEGRAEGLEEGREIEAVRIAKMMKAKNMDFAVISEVTGLPVSEIENL